jgi:quercetin dioxygenase-like cupin family protein
MGAVDLARVATRSFDWGVIKWMVSPDQTPGVKITFGEVVLLPGQGHVRHNHPFSEEILYILSGVGEQMVDDKPPFEVRCGDTILYPHSNLSGDRQHGLGAAAPVGALQSRRRRTGAGRSA